MLYTFRKFIAMISTYFYSGVLSDKDIRKLYGKQIYIWPFKEENVQSASYDLTASKCAFVVENGIQKLIVSDDKIVVPSKKTGIVITNESLYVKERITGTYHSLVGMSNKGFAPISTTLDPGFFGVSRIALQNTTDHDIEINVGDRIATLIFSTVKTKGTGTVYNNYEYKIDVDEFYEFKKKDKYLAITSYDPIDCDFKDKLNNLIKKEFKDSFNRWFDSVYKNNMDQGERIRDVSEKISSEFIVSTIEDKDNNLICINQDEVKYAKDKGMLIDDNIFNYFLDNVYNRLIEDCNDLGILKFNKSESNLISFNEDYLLCKGCLACDKKDCNIKIIKSLNSEKNRRKKLKEELIDMKKTDYILSKECLIKKVEEKVKYDNINADILIFNMFIIAISVIAVYIFLHFKKYDENWQQIQVNLLGCLQSLGPTVTLFSGIYTTHKTLQKKRK